MDTLVEFYMQAPHWQKGVMFFAFYVLNFWFFVWLMWLLLRARADRLAQKINEGEEYRIRKIMVEHLDDMLQEHAIFHPRNALTPAERVILRGERHRF